MARCPACGLRTAEGCLCLTEDSDCFTVTGDGSEATPFVFEPELAVDADQLLTCSDDGLLAELPDVISDPSAVSAYREISQDIPNNTLTVLTLQEESYDTDTMWSVGQPTRLTFTTAGTYIVVLNCLWKNNSTGDRMAIIRKNGTDILVRESKDAGGADLYVGHSIVVQDEFSAADYVEALVHHTAGAALRIVVDYLNPTLEATRVA